MRDTASEDFRFGVAVLAAGRSRRMGRPKLLLPWGATSVIGFLVKQWRGFGAAQIAVVAAAGSIELQTELDQLGFPASDRIINPEPDRGMFSSIACAASWTGWNPGLTHILLTLGDQPHLRPETLEALIECGRCNRRSICQPIRNGRRKHPVLFPMEAFVPLAASNVSDLKQFLTSPSARLAGFNSDDAGLDRDMDTPEDYEALFCEAFKRSAK